MIETCEFGSIVIDGKKHTSDLIIYPDRHTEDGWRRKSGHRLSGDDIGDLIKSEPEVIIAGTGVNGRMKPDRELRKLLAQKGITLIAEPNQNAMKSYNKLISAKRVGACFHLTC
ncbi:Mth938-like domain-containing protein [Desulfonema magnum]|uniref:DUF498 n=1 Tax=Desulfonema magnum TaxID=45655 RepID=A0A975BTF5_9BACT|nr:MTH938/NDUFAF3 family protein [Desulfonema magnum]QTA91298.1 DUF498 [Desulfonema magnum]